MPDGFNVRLEGTARVAAEFRQLNSQFRADVIRITNLRALAIQGDAKRALTGGDGVDTGQYRSSIQLLSFDGGMAAEIGSEDKRARWIEFGTGIFGPRNQPIKPKRGRFLVWRKSVGGRESGPLIFATSVRGRPATPHLIPAFEKNNAEYVNDIQRLMVKL